MNTLSLRSSNLDSTEEKEKKIIENKRFWPAIFITTGLFILFAWPSMILLSNTYLQFDIYSHGFFVPLVSAYASYQLWKELKQPAFRASWFGIPFLFFGASIMILGFWYYKALYLSSDRPSFIMSMGLFLCVCGFYVMWGGFKFLRLFAFPICFFAFAIPFPINFLRLVTIKLRLVVSMVSEDAFNLLGFMVFREGNIIHLPNISLGINDACSGIQSFWILVAGAVVIAYLKKVGLVETLFLCLLTVPISIFMNVLRIVVTGYLVIHFGQEYATGWRHDLAGWFSFVGGLGSIVGLGSLFSQEGTNKKAEKNEVLPESGFFSYPSQKKKLMFILILGVLFSMGIGANQKIGTHYALKNERSKLKTRKTLPDFPKKIGSFSMIAEHHIKDERILDTLNLDEHFIRHYKNENNEVIELRINYWAPLNLDSGVKILNQFSGVGQHYPDYCFPLSGFDRVDGYDINTQLEGIPVEPVSSRIFVKDGQEKCVLFWFKKEAARMPLVRKNPLKTLEVLVASWENPQPQNINSQYLVNLIADVSSSRTETQRSLVNFAKILSPILPEFGID